MSSLSQNLIYQQKIYEGDSQGEKGRGACCVDNFENSLDSNLLICPSC